MKNTNILFGTLLAIALGSLLTACAGSTSQPSRPAPETVYIDRPSAEAGAQGDSYVSSSHSSAQEAPTSNFIGTYEFNDNYNTWALQLNADGTARIRNKSKGGELICYGNWKYFKNLYPNQVSLSFVDLSPKVSFKNDIGPSTTLHFPEIAIDGLWLYKDSSAFDAKNPNLRFKLKKVGKDSFDKPAAPKKDNDAAKEAAGKSAAEAVKA